MKKNNNIIKGFDFLPRDPLHKLVLLEKHLNEPLKLKEITEELIKSWKGGPEKLPLIYLNKYIDSCKIEKDFIVIINKDKKNNKWEFSYYPEVKICNNSNIKNFEKKESKFLEKLKKQLKEILSVIIIVPRIKIRDEFFSSGYLIFYFAKKFKVDLSIIGEIISLEPILELLNNFLSRRNRNYIIQFLSLYGLKTSFNLVPFINSIREYEKSHALRSAIAAIMSRNMSHNIGSHILFYLKMEKLMDLFLKIVSKNKINYKDLSQKIQELIEKLNQIQNNLNSSLNSVKDTLEELERLLKSLSADIRWGILEWIEDTKTFFGYLQHRMDFLAQISTEWPKWTFSAYLMKDIIRNFLMQRHLLDGIAKSEGLRGFYYEWEEPYKKYLECKSKLEKSNEKKEEKKVGRIKIHVFNLSKIGDVKDNQVKKLWNKKHKSIYVRKQQLNNSRVLLYSSDKDSHINIEKDIPIAIPGGITGYHALYVIIENIIRNSAKHGYAKKRGNKGDLEIVIEFTDDFKEPYNYWRFRIYDNVSKIESRISRNKRFRIFDVNEKNKTPETDLVAFMNECLRHSLIKETGEIDRRHWGMAEMKIAAGYLQMRDVQDIGEKDDKITGSMKDQNGEKEDFIIRAIESPIETLGFEFKVKKPKEVGIICTEE